MQNKNEEVIKILEKLEVELEFLKNIMVCIALSDFDLNSSDMLGCSSFIDRIKNDVKESMNILS